MVHTRSLGKDGPPVGCIGYGAMVLEGYYGASDDEQAVKTIHQALDAGLTMLDSADAYGAGHNETLIGRAIQGRRDQALVATKFGIVFDENETGTELPTGWGFSLTINGKPSYAKKCIDTSLQRLGIDTVDLWYLHYPDPGTPIEETVGAMADAVQAGKVAHIGLSNVTAEQIRKAHAVHPIAAVQYEYSLWRREPESDLFPTLRELGIALVAWSPLGAGFLTGGITDLDQNDFRQNNPRFVGDNLGANIDRFSPLMKLAEELEVTPAQLALAWLLHQGDDIIPIPGTRRPKRVLENAGAAEILLADEVLDKINAIARPGLAQGSTLV